MLNCILIQRNIFRILVFSLEMETYPKDTRTRSNTKATISSNSFRRDKFYSLDCLSKKKKKSTIICETKYTLSRKTNLSENHQLNRTIPS